MTFKVVTTLDTGHPDEDGGFGAEDESPNGEYLTFEFETEAEAKAFVAGVEAASGATHGWTEGWLSAEIEGD